MFPFSLIAGLVLIGVMLVGFLWGGKFSDENFKGVLSWEVRLQKFEKEGFWAGESWRSWIKPKMFHVVVFAGLGYLLAGSLLVYGCRWNLAFSVFAVAGGVLFGFATEYLQACFGRGASWWDFRLNAVSVLAGGLAGWVYLCVYKNMSDA